ncbi:MAG: hypothetical protein IPK26_23960 [Planctomycetes bacterium]|nr:hypothetical protein [Planctomycetota bacterium]
MLSLDEAIRLANGSLLPMALSAAEQAQITGAGAMVDTIRIDAAMLPMITLTAPLTALTGMGHHVMLEGMPMGGMGGMTRPMLMGGSQPAVLTLRTHMVHVMGLCLMGGQVGVDYVSSFGGPTMAAMGMLMDCELDGQSTANLKISGVGGQRSSLMLDHVWFQNAPVGVLFDDQTNGGWVMLEGDYLWLDNVALGIDVVMNGRANLSMCMPYRLVFRNGAQFCRMRRNAASSQQFMFRFTFCDVQCTGDVLDVQGNALGMTMVHHHHSDFVAGAGRKAFHVWPRTAEFDLHGSEMTFVGDVTLSGNLFTQRCWQQNNNYRNGTITFDYDGIAPNLLWNRYENCTMQVTAASRAPVLVRSSEVLQTNLDGQSTLAPITLDGCFKQGGTLAGQVTQNNAASSRFLGTASVTPWQPRIGTTVRVSTDLPFGIGVAWDFAIAYPRPVTTQEPVRFYGDVATAVVLPGLVLFVSNIDIPVPNNPVLVGVELYAQPVAVPVVSGTAAPAFHLPRGGLIHLLP